MIIANDNNVFENLSGLADFEKFDIDTTSDPFSMIT